jgi:hypothetical protein
MKKMMILGLVAMLAVTANAAQTKSYGYEDGGVALGSYGNTTSGVNTTEQVNTGSKALKACEDPIGSTPQVYIAFIENLADGDEIEASFAGYDTTPGASPSLRIWAHYSTTGDINGYAGSAGGNDTYTDGTGWDTVSNTWTFDSDGDTRDALVIEARLYSPGGDTTPPVCFYIDDVSVTAPDTATVTVPEPATMSLLALGGLGALIRRRK